MLGWEVHHEARTAPAVARDRDAVLDGLRRVLPARGTVAEIASGSGEHAVYVAAALPALTSLPSDPDPEARRSVVAHAHGAGVINILPPLDLGTRVAGRPRRRHRLHQHDPHRPLGGDRGADGGGARAHPDRSIAASCSSSGRSGKMAGTARTATPTSTRPCARDPDWGVCDREAVSAEAVRPGLVLSERVAIPANNLSLIGPRTRNWCGIRHASARLHIEFSWTNVAHSAGEPDATAEAARAPGGSPCRWNAAFRAGPSPCSQSPD